jgi:hypothetical protein
MGEYADAALWGEMNGRDMDCPEDYKDCYDDTAPLEPNIIAWEASMLVTSIEEHGDDEDPPTFTDLIYCLFPKLGIDQAALVADGLILLAGQHGYD